MMATIELDLGTELGAEAAEGTQRISIYFPNMDKNKIPVPDVDKYVRGAMELLTLINGGVTRMPVATGIWHNKETKSNVDEDTVVVYSNVYDAKRFWRSLPQIRQLLHKFGSSTNQGAVMVEYFGEGEAPGDFEFKVFSIENYDAQVSS